MPHVHTASSGTNDTFDLEKPDRTDSAQPDYDSNDAHDVNRYSQRSSSGMYGVALTSSENIDTDSTMHVQELHDQRRGEVKQQQLRRRSMPGSVDGYTSSTPRHSLTPSVRNSRAIDDGTNYSYNTDVSRRSAQYFDSQFQYKDYAAVAPANPSVQRQSPVIAELKTNVIIKDEFTLVTDLSYQLAHRYSRLESSIMVKVDHTSCLALGGTFDPCYLLTISSVPSHMGPATNRRNASLIQSFMAEILSVPPERGIVTFVPIPEDNLAIGGNTFRADTEKAERMEAIASRKAVAEAARRTAAVKRSMPNLQAHNDGYALVNGSQDSTSSNEPERPRTSYGPSSPGAVNGLRMNPISPDELRPSSPRTSKITRPSSIGPTELSSILKPISPNATKHVATKTSTTQSRQPKTEPKVARSILIDPRKKPTTQAYSQSQPDLLAPRPVQAPATIYNASAVTPFTLASTTSTKVSGPTAVTMLGEARNKSVYLDMVTALPPSNNKTNTITVRSEELSIHSLEDSAAAAPIVHTKRRSATFSSSAPKLPPQPPSPTITAKEETKSMSSRLSKRKSLMKLFKRESAVPAWYKQ